MIDKKLIITKYQNKIVTMLLENSEVVELHVSDYEQKSVELGNIYIGRVKNIVQNIQAAFIEIGDGIECYYSLLENKNPIFTHKIGKKPLCIGDELLVQVTKEAVKTKVPTVNCELNFTGKYAILTSGDTRIGVSNKLNKTESERLYQLASPYGTKEYGFILRTNARDAENNIIQSEIERLISEYQTLIKNASTRTCFSCMRSAPKPYIAELINVYQEGLTEIIVEDLELYEEVESYLRQMQPEDFDKLRLYKDCLLPLHKLYSLEHHLQKALNERVWLKSGAYLVIQPTEALTVIDVNTGKCISKKKDDETYLRINMEAAKEVAKQIRLRNLSGIIIVDFINLNESSSMDKLLCFLQKELKQDPIATTLVDVTKLQLVEITRKKIRKPLYETLGGQI